ncbi:sperm-associated antigen 4 protein-like [Cyrtonyx montezumae]|uniref:sperm-associated antigen 4 protein-like n=1 Tax=Cyrtonyx montezumae TaxID=9017 RepID=UPI0032DBDFDF
MELQCPDGRGQRRILSPHHSLHPPLTCCLSGNQEETVSGECVPLLDFMDSAGKQCGTGATIDIQRTSRTYECTERWYCKLIRLFTTTNHPDTILQPSTSPGKCWLMEGYQGQVVIRLSAEILPICITVQHIFREMPPSVTVSSAPKDVAVLGLDVDRKEEVLLGSFTFDVKKEPIQTFVLKKNPPRAFRHIKFLVKSNWGNPAYTCIYRVMLHGKVVN